MRQVVFVAMLATALVSSPGAWGQQAGERPAPESAAEPTPAAATEGLAESATDRGVALFEKRDFAQAKILLGKAVALDAGDARAQAYLGLVLLNWDADLDGATKHLEAAVRLAPANASYHRWLGGAYTAQAGTAPEREVAGLAGRGREELEKAVELAPADLDSRMALLRFYLSAPESMGGGDAKARAQALAMTGVDRYLGLVAQGLVAEREKEPGRAEQLYRTAIAADPAKGEAYNSLGYLLLSGKRRDEAVATFRRYVAAAPGEANPHDSLAEGLLTAGKVDEAIAEYRRALEIDPRFSSSYRGLAKCYEKAGQWQQARAALERFLEIVPNGPAADDARDELEELTSKR